VIPESKPDEVGEGSAKLDLSKVDFEMLKQLLVSGRRRTVVEKLRTVIETRLNAMVLLNRMRMDYVEKFEQMIKEYNSGSKNIEEFFQTLRVFVQELDEEDQRHMREELSEEELALFDILTKPEMELTEKDKAEVKKVARELLERLKSEKLVLDWRKRQQARADVKLTIETILEELPQGYDENVWQRKCDMVYQHVFDSYTDAEHGVYAVAV